MTKDEALKLALEALEDLGNHDRVCPQWPTYAEPENYPKCNCGYDQAITTIKAALEAKDEPVAFKIYKPTPPRGAIPNVRDAELPWVYDQDPSSGNVASMWVTPVKATPPQRTFLRLTDDEIFLIVAECAASHQHTDIHFARAIETKLKEKNT